MKLNFNKLLVTALFIGLAIAPLCAQTNTGIETNTDATTTVEHTPFANPPAFHFSGNDLKQTLAVMIPIIAIVMGCSIPIVIVGLQLYFRHRKNKMLHETIQTMVEKGAPIPPELFSQTDTDSLGLVRPRRPRNDLRIGLISIGIGAGLLITAVKAGFIVLFMGIAFVISGLLQKNKDDAQPPKV
ncbi:MAG TPA: DUF6249 domain-containing protein [Verrucomicrobiae bacterium]|nr:DUF6249 domain-containing protein [Verrucomicrobiae bacterium]